MIVLIPVQYMIQQGRRQISSQGGQMIYCPPPCMMALPNVTAIIVLQNFHGHDNHSKIAIAI